MLTRDEITLYYNSILNRDPESEDTILYLMETYQSVQELKNFLLTSNEFESIYNSIKMHDKNIRKNKVHVRKESYDSNIWQNVFVDNEYKLLNLFGKTVIDIGANIGAFSCLAAKLGASRVLSFEPFLDNFKLLNLNTARYKIIQSFNQAVSNRSEILKMPTAECYQSQYNESHPGQPINFGGMGAIGNNPKEFDQVQSTTLENIFTENSIDFVDVLKLDCEGSEWPILLSTTKNIFDRIGEIVGEYHLGAHSLYIDAQENNDPISYLKSFLADQGFYSIFKRGTGGLGYFYAHNSRLVNLCVNGHLFTD